MKHFICKHNKKNVCNELYILINCEKLSFLNYIINKVHRELTEFFFLMLMFLNLFLFFSIMKKKRSYPHSSFISHEPPVEGEAKICANCEREAEFNYYFRCW